MKDKKKSIMFIGFILVVLVGLYADLNSSSNTFVNILLLVLGFVLLIKGADYFVDGASGIADRFGIPQIVIGLTIVAFGTSAPEAAVSIGSGLKGSTGLAIGNVVGSNILNILVILGVASCITALNVAKSTAYIEIPFVIFVTAILVVLGKFSGELGRVEGAVLWALFIAFFVYLIMMAKKGMKEDKQEEKKEEKKTSILLLLVITIIGMGGIVIGSNVTVDSASFIANEFGMSERLIGLTIVAFGTSLPELVTSIIAAIKGNADIAIGNIVGSNIFNILFVLGTTALIAPITYEDAFVIDGLIAVAAAVILQLLVIKNRKITRAGGVVMLLSYVGYFVYLLV